MKFNKPFLAALAAITVVSAAQAAGTNESVSATARTPAINTPETFNPHAPVEGRNSFTESQVRERLAAGGYTNITMLNQDAAGIWRASGQKAGAKHDVSLDFQGNITATPAKR